MKKGSSRSLHGHLCPKARLVLQVVVPTDFFLLSDVDYLYHIFSCTLLERANIVFNATDLLFCGLGARVGHASGFSIRGQQLSNHTASKHTLEYKHTKNFVV